jgi:hypothetical protein
MKKFSPPAISRFFSRCIPAHRRVLSGASPRGPLYRRRLGCREAGRWWHQAPDRSIGVNRVRAWRMRPGLPLPAYTSHAHRHTTNVFRA